MFLIFLTLFDFLQLKFSDFQLKKNQTKIGKKLKKKRKIKNIKKIKKSKESKKSRKSNLNFSILNLCFEQQGLKIYYFDRIFDYSDFFDFPEFFYFFF